MYFFSIITTIIRYFIARISSKLSNTFNATENRTKIIPNDKLTQILAKSLRMLNPSIDAQSTLWWHSRVPWLATCYRHRQLRLSRFKLSIEAYRTKFVSLLCGQQRATRWRANNKLGTLRMDLSELDPVRAKTKGPTKPEPSARARYAIRLPGIPLITKWSSSMWSRASGLT